MFNGCGISFWEDEKVLEMDGGDSCITIGIYLMPLICTLKGLKWFILCFMCFTTMKNTKKKVYVNSNAWYFSAWVPKSHGEAVRREGRGYMGRELGQGLLAMFWVFLVIRVFLFCDN